MSIKNLCIYLFFILLFGCGSNNGGVVSTSTPDTTTPSTTKYNGPIQNDVAVPDISTYSPPLTSYDLEQKINQANSGDTIILDKDINMNYSIIIDKPLTIKSLNRISINATNLTTLFFMYSNNVNFENIKFNLYNCQNVIQAQTNNIGLPIYDHLSFFNNLFLLNGNSTLKAIANNINIKNNTIIGLSTTNRDISLASFIGNDINILGNLIFDTTNNYQSGILIQRNNNANINNNIVKVFAKLLYGSITLIEANNINIQGNTLIDQNTTRTFNDGLNLDPDNDGSIGIAIKQSNNVFDNNIPNKTYATHMYISDLGSINGSTNINLNSLTTNNTDNSLIFSGVNDYTPVCLVNINPVFSILPMNNYQTFTSTNFGLIYYAGAIAPACR